MVPLLISEQTKKGLSLMTSHHYVSIAPHSNEPVINGQIKRRDVVVFGCPSHILYV